MDFLQRYRMFYFKVIREDVGSEEKQFLSTNNKYLVLLDSNIIFIQNFK